MSYKTNKQKWKSFHIHRLWKKWQILQFDDWLTTAWWLPYDSLMTAWRLPDDCLMTAWQLLDTWLTTTWWLTDDCLTTAWWLLDDCLTNAWHLTDNYLMTAWQLPDNYLTTIWSPHFCVFFSWFYNKWLKYNKQNHGHMRLPADLIFWTNTCDTDHSGQ